VSGIKNPNHDMSGNSRLLAPNAEVDRLLDAADELHKLARSLDEAGHSAVALHLHSAASSLDLELPQKPGWWSNAFNGQDGRGRLFLKILEVLQPAVLVETGSFRGTTTGFFAERFKGPIFTCEVDPRWYLTAKATLARFPHVDIRRQDSREFLEALSVEIKNDMLLYYLDAHWQNDLPLSGEIELILASDRSAAIMIDDFAVPFDPEYGFDDYGPGKSLTLELLANINPKGASLFFPTLPACEETGARRGCAVIGVGRAASILAELPELRRYDWPARSGVIVAVELATPPPPDMEPVRRLVMARAFETELVAARVEIDSLRGDLERRRAEVDALHGDLEARRAEVDALHGDLEARREEVDALHRETDVLRTSSSWRITGPLRAASRLFKRLFNTA
jgi:predicted O-methyltransferase YrrM